MICLLKVCDRKLYPTDLNFPRYEHAYQTIQKKLADEILLDSRCSKPSLVQVTNLGPDKHDTVVDGITDPDKCIVNQSQSLQCCAVWILDCLVGVNPAEDAMLHKGILMKISNVFLFRWRSVLISDLTYKISSRPCKRTSW